MGTASLIHRKNYYGKGMWSYGTSLSGLLYRPSLFVLQEHSRGICWILETTLGQPGCSQTGCNAITVRFTCNRKGKRIVLRRWGSDTMYSQVSLSDLSWKEVVWSLWKTASDSLERKAVFLPMPKFIRFWTEKYIFMMKVRIYWIINYLLNFNDVLEPDKDYSFAVNSITVCLWMLV